MDGTMSKLLFALLLCGPLAAAEKILIVADEFPAMQVLAAKLKAETGVESDIVKQTEMPTDLSRRPAVIVYIHGKIGEPAEVAFIDYAKNGGKLILLHHSISSGKRPNRFWFDFLGIRLPTGDFEKGGYKYYEDVELDVVNLAPGHYVTTRNMVYDRKVRYTPSDGGKPETTCSGFGLDDTEVYLNHVFTSPKHVLLGFHYKNAQSGKVYMQDRAGWYMRGGKGWVFYFMAGHKAKEFDNISYAQLIVNAFVWKPTE
jgi:hypothetical protein